MANSNDTHLDLALAQELFYRAFEMPRELRSKEYKEGVLAGLRDRVHRAIGSTIKHDVPHRVGTPQADAWFAGYEEGAAIWARHEGRVTSCRS